MIPGGDGSIEVGKRRMNYVWYCICPESSAEFTELTTGKDGWKHRNFVPLGKVRDEVWAKQKAYAKEVLSPPFWEIIAKTVQPGLSIVHDYSASKAAFFDNKVLIVGEALALFRPHMGLSVNQAALHSLLLEKVMRGEMNVKAWERQVVQYGRQTQLKNEAMGNYYVFWGFPFFYSLLRYALSFIIQW